MGQVQVEGIRMKEPQVDGEFLFKSLALVGKRGEAEEDTWPSPVGLPRD
jgi:hypothetical protein